MKIRPKCSAICLLLAAMTVYAAPARAADIRKAALPDAYVVVYGKHNPERDYQKAHFEEVWKTVEETNLIGRFVEIVRTQVPEEQQAQAQAFLDEFQEAVAPADMNALMNASEVVYSQELRLPVQQQLVAVRTTPEASQGYVNAIRNLIEMAAKHSQGKISAEIVEEDGVSMVSLGGIPKEVPFNPMCAAYEDVFLIATTKEAVQTAITNMRNPSAPSKLDDTRFQEAFQKLPAPEDAVVIFDGKSYIQQLRGVPEFIRQEVAKNKGDEKAEEVARFAEIFDRIIDEFAILDYSIHVEYTDGNRNLTADYGKLLPNVEDKAFYKVFSSGEPFQNWHRWVPKNATAFNMMTGANLHPVYDWLVNTLPTIVPETAEFISQAEQFQSDLGIHLDRDILQSFSGEMISMSLPAAIPSPFGGQDSVLLLRCHQEDRIRELIHWGMEKLAEFPPAQSQQIQLSPCRDLDGFEELSATALAPFGVKPVIGFHDGWLIFGSNAKCVRAVLKTKEDAGEDFSDSEAYKRFGLKVDGPVVAIGYQDIGKQFRDAAQAIGQVGGMAAGMLSFAANDDNREQIKMATELLGLLPSVAQVIGKFDFLESKLSVVRAGSEPGTWTGEGVVLVRPAEAP